MDCVFCKIILGDIPSCKVYEDENSLVFLDINPVNHGHTLIIPKKHFASIEDAPEEDLREVIKIVKKIGKAIKSGLKVQGYNVMINNGYVAGQIVSHLHFHLVPRLVGDGLKLWPKGKYGEGEADLILKKIKSAL
ncbi:MAG: HIT family protein [Patescibacteria group bacterium]